MKTKIERIIAWFMIIGTALWQAIEYILQNIPE